jgi:hypothetical protein
MISFNVEIPKNRCIVPYMEIKIFEKTAFKKVFLGFASISLFDLIPQIMKNSQGQKGQEE